GQADLADGRLHVTIEGARHVALALDKATQGFAASELLSVTARNVGLTPIGMDGEMLSYDPLRHEDLEGGLLPGDPVRIERIGWAYGRDVVLRAKVKRT